MDENPYQSPPDPVAVEGGAGLFVALLLTALAMGAVMVSWLSGVLSTGIALVYLLVLTLILLWILSALQRRAQRASGQPATGLTAAQLVLVVFVGLMAAAVTFLVICGGTALGADAFVGGYESIGIAIVGLFAGLLIGVLVGVWTGWKTYQAIRKENASRVDIENRLEVRRAGEADTRSNND